MCSARVRTATPSLTRAYLLVLALAAAGLLSACFNTNAVKPEEFNDLKTLTYKQQKEMASLLADLKGMKEDVARAKAAVQEIPTEQTLTALRTSQTTLYTQVSDIIKEMQSLTGALEEARYSINTKTGQLAADMDVLKSTLDPKVLQSELAQIKTKLASLESDLQSLKAGKPAGPQTPQAAATEDKGKPAPAAESKKPKTAESLYDEAYGLFKQKKYTEARDMMKAFLASNPDHVLAGNAHYWIAETYYSEAKYDNAILSYEEVIKKHSDNRKVPAAILKQAYAFLEIGDKLAARGLLTNLMEKHPETKEAEAARKKLKGLK